MAKAKKDAERELLKKMVGTWSGSVSTWFHPGAPELKEKISGRVARVVGSNAVAHTYRTRIEGKAVQGSAVVGKDIETLRLGLCWVDTFHTGGDVMLFRRDDVAVKNGFSVRGQYAAGPDSPPWGWRTTFELKTASRLLITHYNITPDGTEAVAVKIDYRRDA